MKTAIIYARNIEKRQYEADIGIQLYNCQQCAERHKMEIAATYSDLSTNKLQTYPMFEQMLQDIEETKPDAIIIYSMAMLGRNLSKTQNWLLSMKKKGIEVVFVDIDSSPSKTIYEGLLNYFIAQKKEDRQ